jgi:PTS system fructose-specific IIC component
MARIVAVTGCASGMAHTLMAAEALRRTAEVMGHQIKVETMSPGRAAANGPAAGSLAELSAADIADADVAIVASDVFVDVRRFAGKPIAAVPVGDAIRKTRAVIESAVAEARDAGTVFAGAGVPVDPAGLGVGTIDYAADGTARPTSAPAAAAPEAVPAAVSTAKSVVAVTACPTGIAHTFMAAEALKKGAAALGLRIKVETQGSVGAKNVLTDDDVRSADAVVLAADTFVDTSRFAGKRIYKTSTKDALHDGAAVLKAALAAPAPAADGADLAGNVEQLKAARSGTRTRPYKHLMTGVSYMLPLVTAGGLLIALAFAVGGINAGDEANRGSLGWALMQVGGGAAYKLYVPVLAAFIAYSIADRPGITSGMIGGALAMTLGSGFLGGIVAGFLAGYVTKALNDYVPLPQNLAGLKPVLILPLLSTLLVGLAMIYLAGPPVKWALDNLTAWLGGMQQSSAALLGLILGAMMAFDMGGPVNKAAYTFAVGLLASKVEGPMAAAMAAGMTPPLGLALATALFPARFDADERDAGKVAAVLGAAFITEGAIPFAAKDPLRVIPALMAGSAVTGAISMAAGSKLVVPHGGAFVLLIPNAVQQLVPYVVAIVAGTLVTAGGLWLAKRPAARVDAAVDPAAGASRPNG